MRGFMTFFQFFSCSCISVVVRGNGEKKNEKKKKEKEQKRKQRRDDTKCFSHLLSLFSLLTSVCVLSLIVINNYKFLFEYIFFVQRVL